MPTFIDLVNVALSFILPFLRFFSEHMFCGEGQISPLVFVQYLVLCSFKNKYMLGSARTYKRNLVPSTYSLIKSVFYFALKYAGTWGT